METDSSKAVDGGSRQGNQIDLRFMLWYNYNLWGGGETGAPWRIQSDDTEPNSQRRHHLAIRISTDLL